MKETTKTNTTDEQSKAQSPQVIQNIGYSGNIVVKVVKGKKTVATIKSHNAGGIDLWHFLAMCIAGDYRGASDLRPCNVELYNRASGTDTSASARVLVDTSADINSDSSGNAGAITGYTTTLHFKIPSTYITTSSKINVLKLYGSTPSKTGGVDNICAEVELSDTEAIDPASYSGQYSLIVEWTLEVKNVSATTAAN